MNPTRHCLPILVAALATALSMTGCDRSAEPPTSTVDTPAEPATPAPSAPLPPPAMASAGANIVGVDGNGVGGLLTLVSEGDGARITGTITGLAPDTEHGFHVHDTGDCSAPATGSAGTHLNPDNQAHGAPDTPAHHQGDLPNLRADATGTAPVNALVPNVSVGSRDARDIVGRALVVHADPDDYTTQPSGGSGTPIACGVIELAPEPIPAAPATVAP
jgi:Cu-Zn family superoxide dismutase